MFIIYYYLEAVTARDVIRIMNKCRDEYESWYTIRRKQVSGLNSLIKYLITLKHLIQVIQHAVIVGSPTGEILAIPRWADSSN